MREQRIGARAGAVATAVTVVALSAGCAATPLGSDATSSAGTESAAPASPGTVTCTYRASGTPAVPVDPPVTENVPATGTELVTLTIGGAPVALELDRAAAPCTVNSFLSLADQGYYTGTSCHRLTTEGIFVLQCGDPTATGSGGPGYTFDDELAATTGYPAGTVAMANAGANTNGSQFFLVYADTELPPAYTVFGHMDTESTDAVAAIAYQGHDSAYGGNGGVPNAPADISAVVSG